MGLLSRILSRRARRPSPSTRTRRTKRDVLKRCQVEEMEPRRLMAADLYVGAVYYEDAGGFDEVGDRFQITFSGGEPGTQLTRLVIDTDKEGNGLTIGDVFFDTAAGGKGVFGFQSLEIATPQGFKVKSATVADGGTKLIFELEGFDAGEMLDFTIDVDEEGFVIPGVESENAVAEGGEFQGSTLTATFTAKHFFDVTGKDFFLDAYNSKLDPSGLPLPRDAYQPPNTEPTPIRTAGSIFKLVQVPLPITIAGTVYEDHDLDNFQDNGVDQGISNVQLVLMQLVNGEYVNTGKTTTTDAQGNYKFEGVAPGTYGVFEVQPNGYFSVGATAGNIDGVPAGIVINEDAIGQITVLGGQDSVDNDFAEALPAELCGFVYHDRNNDGNMQAGEEGIGGVQIDVYRVVNGVTVGGAITVFTEADGSWCAKGLRPGDYRVFEHQPNPYLDGLDAPGNAGGQAKNPGDEITGIHLQSGQKGENYKFGELLPNSIRGIVHADEDGDCILDPDEKPLEGVTIQLLNKAGQVIQTTKTNAQGEYIFTGLPAGEYTVRELQPDGYYDGEEMVGTLGGKLSANDTISEIKVISDMHGVDYNFCELVGANLSGFVYVDDNNNGIFEPGEAPIGNVSLELLDANGTPLGIVVTTNAQGFYQFTNLEPGTYGVREFQPQGYFDGLDTAGSHGGSAQNPGDRITGAVLPQAANAVNYNFGELRPASISGRVHADRDGDCILDPDEIPLEGVLIELLDANGNVIDTTRTDENGEYRFNNLKPGTYGVRETQPEDYFDGEDMVGSAGGTLSNDKITNVVLGSGVSGVEYNFCELEPAEISGFVYVDDNDNGVKDPGEVGIGNVTLILLDANGVSLGITTKTNANGAYKFTGLKPGTYGVAELQPSGYFDGKDAAGSHGGSAQNPGDRITGAVLPPAAKGTQYNFGELRPGSISGRVHAETDGDCIFEPGETPLDGVLIQLLDASGNVIDSTRTDEDGRYTFEGLAPGIYSVREIQPNGYFDGMDSVGSVGGNNSVNDLISQIQIPSGVDAVDYDFCEVPPASIAGRVHAETDGDCVFEPGETPLEGVLIELLDAAGNVIDTTRTDAAGRYKFEGLAPGVYSVRESQPDGYFDGMDSVGSEGGNNSVNDLISQIQIGPGVEAEDYDFCEIPPASISGRVFVDFDGDCILDPIEFPLEGVKIQLLDAEGNVVATTETNSSGRYKFDGLAPGEYGIREIQPKAFLDGGDVVGSAGGVNSANDLITEIILGDGVQATGYDFCEMQPESPPEEPPRFVFPPEPDIPQLPPILAGFPPPRPLPRIPVATDGLAPLELETRGGNVIGYTWHLSTINAGLPRDGRLDAERVAQLISMRNDPFGWTEQDLQQSTWHIEHAEEGASGDIRERRFGMRKGIPVTGDFNGDGVADVGVFLKGHWFIDVNGNGVWDSADLWAKLGYDGDLPVTGDWDGDGKDDIGIFGRAWPGDPRAVAAEPGLPDPDNPVTGARKNTPPEIDKAPYGWRTMKLTSQGKLRADLIDHVFFYGMPGDHPVTGDWNGSGTETIGIFRGGRWILDVDGNGKWSEGDQDFSFGRQGDLPIVGDFNGDGVDDVGVFRDGDWIVDSNDNHQIDDQDRRFQHGAPGHQPVTGDFNGDGYDEPATYHDPASPSAVPPAEI